MTGGTRTLLDPHEGEEGPGRADRERTESETRPLLENPSGRDRYGNLNEGRKCNRWGKDEMKRSFGNSNGTCDVQN